MRKRLAYVGGTAAALAAVLIIAFLLPAASQPQGGSVILHLCSKDGKGRGYNKDIDVGKTGFSPGDYSLFTDKLYDRDTGEGYGHDIGRFTFVKATGPRDGQVLLDVTAVTPHGKLTLYGPGKFSQFQTGFRMAVTGGTGRYRNSSGGIVVKNGNCLGHRGTVITANVTLK
jgi:hypothetical protein